MSINYVELRNRIKAPTPSTSAPEKLQRMFGQGLAVPFELEDEGHWTKRSGVDKIRQSIIITLLTPVGRRVLQPDFGSLLPLMVFEHWTQQLQRELIQATGDALKAWVPQILVKRVDVQLDPAGQNIVYVDVQYAIKGTAAIDQVQLALVRGDQQQFSVDQFTINGRQVFAV